MQEMGDLESLVKIIAIIVGAVWAVYRFGLFRERHSKIEFTLDFHQLGLQDNKIVGEVVAILENKGKVRHRINAKEFVLTIRTLRSNSKIELCSDTEEKEIDIKQLNFPYKIISNEPFVQSYEETYIDSEVKQNYSYPISFESDVTFILVKARFNLINQKDDFQTAQKVFKITKETAENPIKTE